MRYFLTLSCLGSLPTCAVAPIPVRLSRRKGLGTGQQRRLEGTATDEARLYGDVHDFMAYHVDVLVGTPGQLQSVIVDTGSGKTAFPCKECTDCGTHIDPPFDPEASSTFSWVACADPRCSSCSGDKCFYSVRYVEGSMIQGVVFEDVLHFGMAARNNRRGPVWLGCHTRETNLFRTQKPSGILGLNDNGWDVLEALAEGPLDKKIVVLCLAATGGTLSLGGINETWMPIVGPLLWVPYTSHFDVDVNSVILGDETVLSSPGTFLFDSGTTFTYFTTWQDRSLRDRIRSYCNSGSCGNAKVFNNQCWRADDNDIRQFPDMKFIISGTTYVWPARGYLYENPPGTWCYSFFGEPPLTFGASFFLNHIVAFDRDQKSIGFAPSPCPEISSRSESDFLLSPGTEISIRPESDPLPSPGTDNPSRSDTLSQECTCDNGTAAGQSACTSDNPAMCNSCKVGFNLIGNA
eukprot:TRINITY_DN20425_c0_g1_i1.p1 TRINITY_DN20425_c0_g1~~TRINITY_DN20425_c0_g1_i1.p1  ORF type:complete len:480 (-),score=37.40 TRINITY_DN20425_c0_g1_i1:73-1461(-)